MASLLHRLGLLSARHPWRVVLAWLLTLVTLGALAATLSTPPSTVVEIPDSEFVEVMDRLEERLPEVSGTVSTAVFVTEDGTPFTPEQEEAVAEVVAAWPEEAPHVTSAIDPFDTQRQLDDADRQLAEGRRELARGERQLDEGYEQLLQGAGFLAWAEEELARLEREDPAMAEVQRPGVEQLRRQVEDASVQIADGRARLAEGRDQLVQGQRVRDAAAGIRFVSEDDSAAITQIGFDLDPQSMEPADRETVMELAAPLEDVGVTPYFGSELTQEMSVVGIGEVIGLATAGLVLLLMLGSLLAAGMPLVVAFIGVGVGLAGAIAATFFFEMHSMTPALALMLGLAVGIDYMLFILNRHRQQYLHAGGSLGLHDSIALATGTAGSAVVFAGATVFVALAALVMSGIPVLGQMGLVAAATVAVAVLVAVTLGPALLALIGDRIAGPRARRRAAAEAERGAEEEEHGSWYVRLATARPWVTVLVVVVGVLVMAIPTTDLRLGLPDGSAEDPASSAGMAYRTVDEAFGPGMNGPLVVVAELPEGATAAEAREASAGIGLDLAGSWGVDSVVPVGTSKDHRTLAWQVVLETGPNDERTGPVVEGLLARADASHAGALGAAYDAEVGLTGRTVANIEISERMGDALPPYLMVVVGLSLLILVLVFRSLVVPLIATGGFLLSIAGAFGVLVAIYQWGWFGSVFGVHTPGPLMSFGPIMIIGVLFGLAMDYQMFMVSGMREAWAHGQSPRRAVQTGFVRGAKVVTAAMLIMAAVFGGFVFSHMVMVRPLGLGLAVGVLIDAVLVRMTLTPALMHLLDDKAWWMPTWLDRLLPDLDVEGTRLAERLTAERAARESAEVGQVPAEV